LGAAVFHQRQTLGGAAGEPFKSLYLGPSFSDDEILAELRLSGLSFRRPENLARETAEGIARGKITGWFQGRMECGPRALGNRSILADPRDPEMKQRLNARVKMREGFRPFAPAVLKERAGDYFSLPAGLDSPHMILAGEVRSERRSEIPAVTHADFTARVQTVDQTINPQFWSVISEFDRITGVPLVLNTSFNENEPIVCRPQEALACFRRTHLDQLAIGSFLVKR
ncbi:MAG: carbamoyltransferase C-terminal domain-containing protein, partial [Bdellovibrionota bacterium]